MTRDVNALIEALVVTRAEFRFQADRLTSSVSKDDDSKEAVHLRNMIKRYNDAAKTTTILIKYQRGRMRRAARAIESATMNDAATSINMQPHIDEES